MSQLSNLLHNLLCDEFQRGAPGVAASALMKLLISLLNAVTDDPFPVESDSHEDFVLGTPAQTIKVLVTLNGISSIVWPEGYSCARLWKS